MFEIVKNVILNQNYNLEDILKKVDVLWLENKLTEEEKAELISMAREKALPENSYKSIQEQIDTLYIEMKALKNEVANLKGTSEEETTVEEYPLYVQPAGSHDSYNKGDKTTFNNKRYVSTIDNNVWNPEVYPQGWREVVEATETEVAE